MENAMLISFTVENFRSIDLPITLDMQAMGQISELKDNLIKSKRDTLLRSAVIYGANGSGKSNIIKAYSFFKRIVFESTRLSENARVHDLVPFLLSERVNNTSSFEIEVLTDCGKYRYGFEINQEEIVAEWLYHTAVNAEKLLFIREENIIDCNAKFKEGKGLESKTNDKALFLTVCAEFNGEIAKQITSSLRSINVISGLDDHTYRDFTADFIKDKLQHDMVVSALKQADFGITAIKEGQISEDIIPSDMPKHIKNAVLEERLLFMQHKRFTECGDECGVIDLPIAEESMGTQKYFHLMGPIHDTLQNGKTIIIDELDSRLHPMLTLNIISMFHDPEVNKKGAQLIFATHDTHLLSSNLFRRDQIYFTEKTNSNATDLYSLAEFKLENGRKVRKDASYQKDYLNGRYGAIPFIGALKFCDLHIEKASGN
jgi:AAA15 family ATPase/GTPase